MRHVITRKEVKLMRDALRDESDEMHEAYYRTHRKEVNLSNSAGETTRETKRDLRATSLLFMTDILSKRDLT